MENEKKDSNVKSTIDAVTGLAKAIPIYDDAVQPAAKEIGKSLATVTKTVNIALAPIKALVWGYEQIENYLTKRISEKLEKIPKKDITTPPIHIAGPAVEAMRYSANSDNLRELYANLLANSMNIKTKDKTHPGFVEVLKNLSPDEARLIQIFKIKKEYPKINIERKAVNGKGSVSVLNNFTLFHSLVENIGINLIPSYIDNMNRLGLIEISHTSYFTAPNTYEPIENSSGLDDLKQSLINSNYEIIYKRGFIKLTSFGENFIDSVVK